MANKFFTKLLNRVTGGSQKLTQTQQREHDMQLQDKQTQDRLRELSLAACLNEIDLGKGSALSQKQLDSLEIPGVIRRARYLFCEKPVVIDQDMTEIDERIKFMIYELGRSIREGHETTARWACVALAVATDVLHVRIENNDQEYADALMKERRKYAQNLELLVKNAREYDWCTRELNTQLRRYNDQKQELEKATEAVQKKIDTREGMQLLLEIKKHANDPMKMSVPAKELQEQLRDLHRKSDSLIGVAIAANTIAEQQSMYAGHVDECRNHVALYPRVTDPNLLAKNEDANNAYIDELTSRLTQAERGRAILANYLSQMMNLGKHVLFQQAATEALDMAAKLQMADLREKEDALEAAQALVRQKEQSKLLKQIEQQLDAALKKLEEEPVEEPITVTAVEEEDLEENEEEVLEEEEEEDYEEVVDAE